MSVFKAWVASAGLIEDTPAPPPRPTINGIAGDTTPYARSALAREFHTLATTPPNTRRNHQLNESAFNLGQLVGGGQIPEAVVIEQLTIAARQCGLGESEIAATLRSGLGAGKAQPRQPEPREAIAPAHTIDPAAVGGDDQIAAAATRFIPGGRFILDEPDVPPAIWGAGNELLWVEGESLMIAGPMGLGKTTLGGQLMRAQLGIGPNVVLGLAVKPAQKILYLAMDRPRQAARSMKRQFAAADREVLNQRLVIWPGPPPKDVAREPHLLAWLAEQAGADVVYLDSVKDAATGLSEDAVGAGYNRARQTLLAAGRELCELHHTTKRGANGGPPKDVSDIYGSAWITNGTGSIILLSGEPGDPIVGFRHVRQPMNEVGPWQLLHDQTTGVVTVHHLTDVIELARAAGADGLTARALAIAELDDEDAKPTRGQIEKARRKLNDLEDKGLLHSVEGSRGGGADRHPTAWFIVEQAAVL